MVAPVCDPCERRTSPQPPCPSPAPVIPDQIQSQILQGEGEMDHHGPAKDGGDSLPVPEAGDLSQPWPLAPCGWANHFAPSDKGGIPKPVPHLFLKVLTSFGRSSTGHQVYWGTKIYICQINPDSSQQPPGPCVIMSPGPSPPSHVPDRPPFQVLMAASQQSPTQSCITESKGSCGPGTARSMPCLTHLGFREILGSRLRSHPLPQVRRLRANNKWPAWTSPGRRPAP